MANHAFDIQALNEMLTTGLPIYKLDPANDETVGAAGAGAAGGLSSAFRVSAASTNAEVLKASPGRLYYVAVFCTNAAIRYLKLYNKATTPDQNDGALILEVIPGLASIAATPIRQYPNGLYFSSGLGVRCVTGVGNTDNNAVALGDLVFTIGWK